MCNQTQDTDRLESNRQMYCFNVNEQRKQVSKCRYNLLPGYERSWDDGVCFLHLLTCFLLFIYIKTIHLSV